MSDIMKLYTGVDIVGLGQPVVILTAQKLDPKTRGANPHLAARGETPQIQPLDMTAIIR
jgi:hypothetical protein